MTEVSSGDKFRAGVHYEIVDNPTTVRDPSKIEVTEVFWFGCNHCYALEPYIARWKKEVPSDVAFIKSPDNISIELLQEGKKLAPKEPWISMKNIGEW